MPEILSTEGALDVKIVCDRKCARCKVSLRVFEDDLYIRVSTVWRRVLYKLRIRAPIGSRHLHTMFDCPRCNAINETLDYTGNKYRLPTARKKNKGCAVPVTCR